MTANNRSQNCLIKLNSLVERTLQLQWMRNPVVESCALRWPSKMVEDRLPLWTLATLSHKSTMNNINKMLKSLRSIQHVKYISPYKSESPGGVVVRRWTYNQYVMGSIPARTKLHNNLGQVVHTYMPPSPASITWYWSKNGDVLQLERWLQAWWKVMAAYCRDGFLKSKSK